MKFCMLYDNHSRYLRNADEIILKYQHKTSEIIEHIGTYKQEKRIILNVYLLDNETLMDCKEIFAAAAEKHPNMAILGEQTQAEVLTKLELPFFFANIVDSWDKLNAFINCGVSDVYIGNEFGFSLKKISQVCKENNVNIRVYPNVAQTSTSMLKPTINSFYIRPEDLKYYEDLVDVIEFFGPLDRQDVLFKIYSTRRWLGELNTLIIGLEDESVNNTIFLECFGAVRTNCDKRCSYSKGCNMCTRFISINKTIEEVVKHERESNETAM